MVSQAQTDAWGHAVTCHETFKDLGEGDGLKHYLQMVMPGEVAISKYNIQFWHRLYFKSGSEMEWSEDDYVPQCLHSSQADQF